MAAKRTWSWLCPGARLRLLRAKQVCNIGSAKELLVKDRGDGLRRSKLLIADSNLAVVEEITARVAHLNLETIWAPRWFDVIKFLIQHQPDAIILRDKLPDISGFEIARLIRTMSDAPILFISDHSDRSARKRGLLIGDEYFSLPGQWERLPGRMAALLKRHPHHVSRLSENYDDGYLKVDISKQVATREGNPIHLSNTEFHLLSYFICHRNQALSYSEILQDVWGDSNVGAKSEVAQYLRHLRRKIEVGSGHPVYFQSVRSVGYVFVSRT